MISLADNFLHRWLVYPLVVVGTAGFYLQDLWHDLHVDVLPGIIAFVTVVFYETIQRLESIVLATDRDQEFASLSEAEGEMRRIVAKDRRETRVRVIAGPDGHILEATLPCILASSRAKRVHLDLQFVDETAELIQQPYVPRRWNNEARGAVEQARETFENEPRVKLCLSKYKYFPVLHGILINDRYLFLGFWGWGNGDGTIQLSGADRPQRLYVRHDPHTEHFFYLFEDWFENAPKKGLVREVDRWQGRNWDEPIVKKVAKRVATAFGREERTEPEHPEEPSES